MASNGYIKKRPCRICSKWFMPNPRLGVRQKTCGAEECKAEWHTRKCAQWNQQNRPYFQAIHLSKKLQACQSQETTSENPPSRSKKVGKSPQLPQKVIQEVIGVQQSVIIEYISQVLLKRVQEVIRKQTAEISVEADQLLRSDCSRSDRVIRSP
ncbi:MAG: hypothetical protein GQ542_00975 [Desulforhopalus sp.]|nr:hypothetical protein [Desulforhopalus sp.]